MTEKSSTNLPPIAVKGRRWLGSRHDGKRGWITDGAWLAKNGYQASVVIETNSAGFYAIPEGP